MVYEGVNQLTAGFTGDAKDLFRRMRPDSGHEGGILTVIKGNFDDGQSDPNNVKSQATGSYSAWVMKAKQTTYRNKNPMNIPIVFQSAWKLALFPSKCTEYPDGPRGSGLMSIKDFDTKAFRALSGVSLGEFHGAALSAPKMLVLLLMAEILHQLRLVYSLSHYLQSFIYIPAGCLGFLPSTERHLAFTETWVSKE